MKSGTRIAKLEIFPVNMKYITPEVSSITARDGITQTVVKITTDDGLVGWGESPRTADATHIAAAIEAMRPLVLGRDPWDTETIAHDIDRRGMWTFQPMTRNIAYSGIDLALWDICGKLAGQPLYRLFGGARRDAVDYFYYVHPRSLDDVRQQAEEGVRQGYSVFYIKAGVDRRNEEEQLEVLRKAIGPDRRIRIDCNMAWSAPEAVRLINRWDEMFQLDFVEAPVRVDPLALARDVKSKTRVPICFNEGLWREEDVLRVVQSRCADVLCFCGYWVGTLRRFLTLGHYAHLEGIAVCKHTPGELGLMAAAGQHAMLTLPNACDGNQQTAQLLVDDILTERLPIAAGPTWGRIEKPGLGVEVDEDKLRTYHQAYLSNGAFPPYGRLGPSGMLLNE